MIYQAYTKPPTSIWDIMAPVKGRIISAIALAALSSIAGIGSLLAIPPIAAALLSESTPIQIWQWIALALGMVAIAFTARVFAFHVSHIAAFKLEVILRTALTTHLAQVPLGYIITTGSGAIKKIVQDDVKLLHAFVADSTPLFGQAYTIPILSLIAMFIADWRLGLVTLKVPVCPTVPNPRVRMFIPAL
ncbi:ABC transporter transmembrane domain-containing protein [Gloeocapsa sp. BRSZ]